MTPTAALSRAIDAGLLLKRLPPGAVVERLPADVREALKRLTSDEARRMRP